MRRCIPVPDLDRPDASGRTRELSIRGVRERKIVRAELQHGGLRLPRLEAQAARVPAEAAQWSALDRAYLHVLGRRIDTSIANLPLANSPLAMGRRIINFVHDPALFFNRESPMK